MRKYDNTGQYGQNPEREPGQPHPDCFENYRSWRRLISSSQDFVKSMKDAVIEEFFLIDGRHYKTTVYTPHNHEGKPQLDMTNLLDKLSQAHPLNVQIFFTEDNGMKRGINLIFQENSTQFERNKRGLLKILPDRLV